jgi:hypothetical protein
VKQEPENAAAAFDLHVKSFEESQNREMVLYHRANNQMFLGNFRKAADLLSEFLDAFPESSWLTPVECFGHAYALRMFHRFAESFGLVEIRRSDPEDYLSSREARTTPLFREVVQFHVERPRHLR